jgi:hypothetical protein
MRRIGRVENALCNVFGGSWLFVALQAEKIFLLMVCLAGCIRFRR